MEEVWKPIKGYEELYEVSNMGRVRSLTHTKTVRRGELTYEVEMKGKTLKPSARRHGYLGVMLYGKGGHPTRGFKSVSVHTLVATAFVENPHGYKEVNHKDEDKTNNRADNLEWCDRKYNTNYGTCQQRRSEKTRNNPKKSTRIAQYTLDGEFVREYPSYQELRRLGYFNIHSHIHGSSGHTHPYGYIWKEVETSK